MQADLHERCRLLIDRAMLEGVSQDEQRWLDVHKDECLECRRYAELSLRAIEALGSLSVAPDPAAALRVRQAVRLHTERLASNGIARRTFYFGLAAAVGLTITGSVAMWQTATWLAARWNIPPGVWQPGFTMFWLLPSVALDVVLLFSRRLIGRAAGREGQAA